MSDDLVDPRSWLPLRAVTLRFAEDMLGVEEIRDNEGEEVEMFQQAADLRPGDPWCAAFVNWCAEQGARLRNETSPLEDVPLQGYVQSYYEYGDEQLWIRSPDEPAGLGDIFLMYFDSKGRYAHMGLVRDPMPGESVFTTVEGNTSADATSGSADDREGQGVYSKKRHATDRIVFLDWTE